MGRLDEAVAYFLRSQMQPDHPPQVYANIIQCYLDAGQPGHALRWLETMRLEKCLDERTVMQIAEAFERQQNDASAIEVLHRGTDMTKQIEHFQQKINQIKKRRAKIAFFCGADGPAFLHDIIDYVKQRYPVRYFEGKSRQDIFELMQWSDISWFEWCTELAKVGADLPKVCHMIVRLHRYEAHLNWPKLINWKNVDTLVTVGNEWVLKAVNHWVGDISRLTSVVTIPNGVNLDAIPFKKRKPGNKIAFIAKLRMVKNPMLLVQCMAELLKLAPEYKLCMAGEMHDLLLRQYLEHMTKEFGIADAFVYDGWQENIQSWLQDKSYIVSTSVIESQGMGILEAMACGIKPVIHNFPGAAETFGNAYLFNTPREFCRHILEEPYDSEQYRATVERCYALTPQLRKVNELLALYEKTPLSSLQTEYPIDLPGFCQSPISSPV
jgi:glycosyltransferase involved in cell wall biosynthesis